MPGRQKYELVSSPRPDQRKLVGSSGTKSRPGSYRRQLRQARRVLLRALQHARQHGAIHLFVLRAILPRRTDENLTGAARLHIERYRIAARGMSALQIAEFHQLMPHESGIAVSDN